MTISIGNMRNSKVHCSNIFRELCIKAEDLASDNNKSLINEQITIEVDDKEYEFEVSLNVENYEYEEETNSASYNSSVFVTKIPKTDNEEINVFLSGYILNEVIYKD